MKKLKKRSFGFLVMFLLMVIIGCSLGMQSGNVVAKAASNVRLNEKNICIIKGQTKKLRLKEADGKIKWKSKNKSIATVSKKGMVTAKRKGTTQIYARYNGKSYKCTVRVEIPKINKKKITIEGGETAALKMTGTKQKVTWTSTCPNVAVVNKKGVVTAKQAGTAVIKAKIDKKTYQCKVTVPETKQVTTEAKTEENKPDDKTTPESEKNDTKKDSPDIGPATDNLELRIRGGYVLTMEKLAESRELAMTLRNNTNEKRQSVFDYCIAAKVDGKWTTIKEAVLQPQAVDIAANGSYEFTVDLDTIAYDWQPGEYQIGRDISDLGGHRFVYAEFSIVKEADYIPVQMEIQGNTVFWLKASAGKLQLPIVITNNLGARLLSSEDYVIEQKQNGEWTKVINSVSCWESFRHIYPGMPLRYVVDLQESGYDWQPGEYRICQTVVTEDGTELPLYAQFTLKEYKNTVDATLKINGDTQFALKDISSVEIPVTLTNHTDMEAWSNIGYHIEQKQNGEWKCVGTTVFLEAMESIHSGMKIEFTVPMGNFEYEWQIGEYRIKKDISVEGGYQDLYAEFTIAEEAEPFDAGMEVKDNAVLSWDSMVIPIILKNHMEQNMTSPSGYTIEMKKAKDNWMELGFIGDAHTTTTIAAKESLEWTVDIRAELERLNALQAGTYRIGRTVSAGDRSKQLWVEFVIPVDVTIEAEKEPVISLKEISESAKLPLQITNNTDMEAEASLVYCVDMKDKDGIWKLVGYSRNYGDKRVIQPRETVKYTFDLSTIEKKDGFEWKPGEYRITNFVDMGEENSPIYFDFTITE